MSESTGTPDSGPQAGPRIHSHDDCKRCPSPNYNTTGLGYTNRVVLQAVGDVQVMLLRQKGEQIGWDAQVNVYSVEAGPGQPWDIEHWAHTGSPSYIPPNCPEWLWVLYTLLGDMCSHFMDLHEFVLLPEAQIQAELDRAKS